MRTALLSTVVIFALCTAASADPTTTFTLESSKAGQTVTPGTTIDWTIKVLVSGGDNAGLALVTTDLVQSGTNPAFLNIAPAGGVPSGMTNFSRPAGISNPGEGGATTGYIGVQRSPGGQTYKNLIQIGGGQNTFGTATNPGSGIAENANVVAGVGQGTQRIVATGSFAAPGTSGTYTFQLEHVLANVLDPITPPPVPPAHWPVSRATVITTGATFSFTVSPLRRGDLNCDGAIDFGDIDPFVLALTDQAAYQAQYPNCNWLNADVNCDGTVNFSDIDPFVTCLSGGNCNCP